MHQLCEESDASSESKDEVEWISNVILEEDRYITLIGTSDIMCHMIVHGKDVVFQVDTGSRINILPKCYAGNAKPISKRLNMYNDVREDPVGVTRVDIFNPKKHKKYSVEIVVVKQKLTPILGLKATQQMGPIAVNILMCHMQGSRISKEPKRVELPV